MLVLLLLNLSLIFINCIDKYPQFYAVGENDDSLEDLSLYVKLGECPLWKSTDTNDSFLYKSDDGQWNLKLEPKKIDEKNCCLDEVCGLENLSSYEANSSNETNSAIRIIFKIQFSEENSDFNDGNEINYEMRLDGEDKILDNIEICMEEAQM